MAILKTLSPVETLSPSLGRRLFVLPEAFVPQKLEASRRFASRSPRSCNLLLWLLLISVIGHLSITAAEVVMTESQVKALCLLNFAKYIVWPDSPTTNAIRIAVMSRAKMANEVKTAATGKLVDGRKIEVVEVESIAEAKGCHILFVGSYERDTSDLLEKLKEQPILTVGEGESFVDGGGIISFVPRENKVRFEVNLSAARHARLQISSKLLTLADKVRGKQSQ